MQKKTLWITLGILVAMILGVLAAIIVYQPQRGAGAEEEPTQTVQQESPDAGNESTAPAEPAAQNAVSAEDLAGPWHLAEGENDDAAVHAQFPGAMEFGSGMDIGSDGTISWYIGADGASGTYSCSGAVLHAELTSDLDHTAITIDLTAEEKDGQLRLTMEYQGLVLCWSPGAGETGKGE